MRSMGLGTRIGPTPPRAGFDSNVLAFFRAYQDPDKDLQETNDRGSLYLKGIGRRAETHTGSVVAQTFGLGGHLRIGIMMDRLAHNCDAGDTTIDVVGFSRGAALAVSFANEVARKLPIAAHPLPRRVGHRRRVRRCPAASSTPATTCACRPMPGAATMRWRSTKPAPCSN